MAAENTVVGCHSVESWNDQFQKGKESKKLVVVDFTASWCGPCKVIAPILADIAKNTPEVVFLKVDVDELQSVAAQMEVKAMPTLLFFKEGELVHKIVGAKKDELTQKVKELSAIASL